MNSFVLCQHVKNHHLLKLDRLGWRLWEQALSTRPLVLSGEVLLRMMAFVSTPLQPQAAGCSISPGRHKALVQIFLVYLLQSSDVPSKGSHQVGCCEDQMPAEPRILSEAVAMQEREETRRSGTCVCLFWGDAMLTACSLKLLHSSVSPSLLALARRSSSAHDY